MKLSAPIYHLKRLAKAVARKDSIALSKALDRIARNEGYGSWSLLSATASVTPAAHRLWAQLGPGDLLLLGARPGHGKTMMALRLIVNAIEHGYHGVFFTLEFNGREVVSCFRAAGGDPAHLGHQFEYDSSDAITADYIIDRLGDPRPGTVVAIDYLQLLDQKRSTPQLMLQVRALRAFAETTGIIIVFISQIDRTFDASAKPFPDLSDVRLPNPLDLSLFDKSCFLNDGQVSLQPPP